MEFCEKCTRCHDYGLRDDEECEWYGEPSGCNHPNLGFSDKADETERGRALIKAVLECEGVKKCIEHGCDSCRYNDGGCNSKAVVEAVKAYKGTETGGDGR